MKLEVDLIGVPFDLGGGRSGAREGPNAFMSSCFTQDIASVGATIRYYDLRAQGGIIEAFDTTRDPEGDVYYEREVAQVAKLLSVRTCKTLFAGRLPVVLGGDHSISIGSVGGAIHHSVSLERKLGLVWIDAHLDAHTHLTTKSHRAHGLPLATLLGCGPDEFVRTANAIRYDRITGCKIGASLSPLHVIHIGAGEEHCEEEEYAFFAEHHVPEFSRKHLKQNGLFVLEHELRLLADSVDSIWVSLDLDALDSSIAPGVYYPNQDGLLQSEILYIAQCISRSGKLCGVDIMEYNPQFDRADKDGKPLTIEIATKFLQQLLGM